MNDVSTIVIHVRDCPGDDWIAVDGEVVLASSPRYVYIGRKHGAIPASIWGNEFIIGRDGTRAECCRKYREAFPSNIERIRRLPELVERILVCFCKPAECHGDYIASRANGLAPVHAKGKAW